MMKVSIDTKICEAVTKKLYFFLKKGCNFKSINSIMKLINGASDFTICAQMGCTISSNLAFD